MSNVIPNAATQSTEFQILPKLPSNVPTCIHTHTHQTGEKDSRGLLIHCNNKYQQDVHEERGEEQDGGKDCVMHKEACPWMGELGDLDDHHRTCSLQLVPCPNKCMENGEKVLVVRRDVQRHLSSQCLNRNYSCPHCGAAGKYLELATVHLESCSKLPVECTNKQCNRKVSRDSLKSHITTECPYTILPCVHKDIGCSRRLQRINMAEHERNLSDHVTAARSKIESLEKEIARLKESVVQETAQKQEVENAIARERLNRRGTPVTFKMTNYSSRTSQNKPFKSSSFYTSPRGYKMCVIIEPNTTSKGQYLAVYSHLMKGDNDDLLTWPLTGTVTFELINQLGNHTHKKGVGTFPLNDKENRRVTEEGRDIADTGYGCPKFISCSKLGEGSQEVQYLKDDCLYWRVTPEVPDTLDQHWLKTTSKLHYTKL